MSPVMSESSVHAFLNPGVAIVFWLVCVIIVQSLDGVALLAALLLLGSIAAWVAPKRSGRLLRRVRVLLAAIAVLFCGFTPGEAVFVDWPAVSPSREGVMLAFAHGGRLVCAVLCVAMLMELLPSVRLIAGVHALLAPLAALGVPAERIAVRTLLVMQHVEAAAPRQWRDWLQGDDAMPAPLRFDAVTWSCLDRVMVVAGVVATALVIF